MHLDSCPFGRMPVNELVFVRYHQYKAGQAPYQSWKHPAGSLLHETVQACRSAYPTLSRTDRGRLSAYLRSPGDHSKCSAAFGIRLLDWDTVSYMQQGI